MMRDDKYRVFFCDRVGDTYRWKGENVSTNEVGDILSKAPQIYLANVYGVEVKGIFFVFFTNMYLQTVF